MDAITARSMIQILLIVDHSGNVRNNASFEAISIAIWISDYVGTFIGLKCYLIFTY